MRKVVHRVLSAFPMFAPAVLGVLAAADPVGAKRTFDWWTAHMSDSRFFWLSMLGIGLYFLLWWVTSLESKPRRQKIREGLQPHFETTSEHFRLLKSAETDGDFLAIENPIEEDQSEICDWIRDNVGPAAFAKFITLEPSAGIWIWPGEHDPQVKRKRDNMLSGVQGRLANLQVLMQSEGWDGPAPTMRQRISKRLKAGLNRLPT
jgi:hypothetical protein